MEAAARFKPGAGFSGDKIVGYKMHHNIMRRSGYGNVSKEAGFSGR